jgi:hypothetical protein
VLGLSDRSCVTGGNKFFGKFVLKDSQPAPLTLLYLPLLY